MIFNYLFLNKKFYFYYFNRKFIDKKNRKKIDVYYIGEYRKGIKHGYGKLYNKSGNLLFVGIYNNGNKCKGKEYQDNKIIFYGEYKDYLLEFIIMEINVKERNIKIIKLFFMVNIKMEKDIMEKEKNIMIMVN